MLCSLCWEAFTEPGKSPGTSLWTPDSLVSFLFFYIWVLDVLEDDTSSTPESHYSFNPEGRPELELLLNTRSTSMVLDLPGDTWDPDCPEVPLDIQSNSPLSKDQWESMLLSSNSYIPLDFNTYILLLKIHRMSDKRHAFYFSFITLRWLIGVIHDCPSRGIDIKI